MYYKLGTTGHANRENKAECIDKQKIIVKIMQRH